ncbi:spore coat protein I [Paenibacillus sp. J2TS4]|nr:spore coat protein I [Paenibacillus sp. J2TS4]
MDSRSIALARKVLNSYSIRPNSIQVVQGGGMKTVWMVNTLKRTYCLKRLKHGLKRMNFSIQAQKYIKDHKAQVADIVKTKKGAQYIVHNGQLFLLYEWVHGIKPDFSSSSDLKKSIEVLAHFHKASAGFAPRTSCRESTKWGKWPIEYHNMMEDFKSWGRSDHFRNIDEPIREIIGQGKHAKALLSRSYYANWIRKNEKVVCHQDIKEDNVVLTRKGCVILDLDSITYDLPLRDLRDIIHTEMLKIGKWDSRLFQKIISWYISVNPLTSKELKVLYIDCLFPHAFHATAASVYKKRESVSSSILTQVIEIERSKKKDLLQKI